MAIPFLVFMKRIKTVYRDYISNQLCHVFVKSKNIQIVIIYKCLGSLSPHPNGYHSSIRIHHLG